MTAKPKIALYWAAGCGGCEIAVLDIGERVLDLIKAAEIVFWPAAMDTKYADLEQMPDQSIEVCLFNGAIRTSENEHMARLLRAKSKVLVAFGSCATEGCIPALANLTTAEAIFERAYQETPTTDNPEGIRPQTRVTTQDGQELTLPTFYDSVWSLPQVVRVDYFVPGCAPIGEQVWSAVAALLSGSPPPAGSVLGAGQKTVCDECDHKRQEKRIKRFYRPHEIETDATVCLLEQGLVCMGPATRAGCEAACLRVNMPCRGCYGAPPGVVDQGAHMISALGSVIDSQDPREIEEIIGQIEDPAGTFYRFGMAASLLFRARVR